MTDFPGEIWKSYWATLLSSLMWIPSNPLLVPPNYKISSPNIKKDILPGTPVAVFILSPENFLVWYTRSPHSTKSQKATRREQQNTHPANQEGISAARITAICQTNKPRYVTKGPEELTHLVMSESLVSVFLRVFNWGLYTSTLAMIFHLQFFLTLRFSVG